MNGASGKQKMKSPTSRIPQPRSQRTISLPILVGTVVTLLILLPGLYFWRIRQVEQGANVYLERAELLAKEENWAKSADYLHLYLRLRPDDAAARVLLAETADKAAVQRPQILRAIELYYQALAEATPEETAKIRLRLGDLLIQSQQFASAISEAKSLLQRNANDVEANRLLALAMFGAAASGGLKANLYEPENVGLQLEKAFGLKPADVALATTLADILRKHPELQSESTKSLSDAEREAAIERNFDQLVAAAPKQASAYLARYQERVLRAESQSGADDDIRMALELGPQNPVVLVSAASHERQAADRLDGQPEARAEHLRLAGEYYARALREAPAFDRAYVGLGDVQQLLGETDQAVQTWQQGIEKCGPDSVILHALLADAFITQGKFQPAEDHLERIADIAESFRRRGLPEGQLTFARSAKLLSARLSFAQGDTPGGRSILQELAKGPKGDSSEGLVTYQALMMLAGSHAAQEREAARAIYLQAAATQPTMPDPHLALAALELSGGDLDRAVVALEKAVAIAGTPENRMLLVGTLFQSQLKREPAERNWDQVDAALEQAKQAIATANDHRGLWRLGLLEAEYRARRAGGPLDTNAAQSVLVATEKAMPPSSQGLVNLAEAYARYGLQADEDRVLELLRTTYPESAAATLAMVRALSARGQLDAARDTIVKAIEHPKPDQKRTLQLALARLLVDDDKTEEAWQLLSEVYREKPQDVEVLQQLMELALSPKHLDSADALEAEFAKLPSVRSVDMLNYRARRLLATANPSSTDIQEVERIVEEIKREAPEAPAGYILAAELFERKGFKEQAVLAYEDAIRRGDRQLNHFERLIVLLNQLARFSEAANYLSALQGAAPQIAELSALEILTALGSGQTDTALKLARQRVAKRPADPLAQVWLGQVLMAISDFKGAEQAFSKSLELAPTDPRTQGAMLSLLVRSGQKERAREKLLEFVDGLQVSPVEKSLVLAAGFESMGAREEALDHLRKAEQLEPSNAQVHERIGLTLLQKTPAEAEKSLRRALELDPRAEASRRALAAVIADRGGAENWQAAIDLLGETRAGGANATSNQRMQASMLTRRGGPENLAKAKTILEKLVAEGSALDRFPLAQIAELEGNTQSAGEQYLALASAEAPKPPHVAAYIDWLLRQDTVAEVAPWMAKLEMLDPSGVDTVGLKVRWLMAAGRNADIESAIEGFAQKQLQSKAGEPPSRNQKLDVSRLAGDLYLSGGDAAAAERWHRRTFALEPLEYGRLANTVAKQGRVAEAIDICEQAATRDASHRPAQVLAGILVSGGSGASALPAAEKMLNEAVSRYADQAELLTAVANLRVVQQRPEDAIPLYQRVIELQPDNIAALNNLAAILADQPNRAEEALRLLDKAIETVGPQPNLLDTKGTVLLTLNRTEEAIPLLRAAARSPNPDPRFLFHLAVCHSRTGEMVDARKAFEDAQRRKLSETVLTKEDSEMLAELIESLR